MKIKETGKVIAVKRAKQRSNNMISYVLTMQSLVRKNAIIHYEQLKTEPYFMDNDNLVKVEVGDYLHVGTDIIEGVGHCPECGGIVFLRTDRNNKITYTCENGSCPFSIPGELKGYEVKEKDAHELLSRGRTRLVRGFNIKDKVLDGYLYLDDNGELQMEKAADF